MSDTILYITIQDVLKQTKKWTETKLVDLRTPVMIRMTLKKLLEKYRPAAPEGILPTATGGVMLRWSDGPLAKIEFEPISNRVLVDEYDYTKVYTKGNTNER